MRFYVIDIERSLCLVEGNKSSEESIIMDREECSIMK